MQLPTIARHPAFPALIWAIVEQPPGAPYRFDYHPEDGSFRVTPSLSLFYDRGFSGAYGWVGGLGTPPDPHADVIILTDRSVLPGDVFAAHVCGVFYRADGDHKLVALDAALRATVDTPDLAALDPTTLAELRALYPRVGPGEGWRGAAEARAYLARWPSPPGTA